MYQIYELREINMNGLSGFILVNPNLYDYNDSSNQFNTQFNSEKEAEEELERYKKAKSFIYEDYTILKVFR